MVAAIASHPPLVAPAEEADSLRHLACFLADRSTGEITIVGADDGEPFRLPDSVVTVLRQAVSVLALGDAVSVLPVSQRLSSFQAAELLNMPHQYLLGLLDSGEMPSEGTGGFRRVALADVLSYRAKRDAERRRGLLELVRMSEELGLYDESQQKATIGDA